MTLLSLYKRNRLFFILFLVFFVIAAILLNVLSKADTFYFLNPYHNDFTTWFFIFFTWLGDGIFCIATGILLFIFKRRFVGLMILSSYAISGIIAQVLKYFVTEARPAVFLKDSDYRYFIDDVTLHNLHGFPSGHTASAFALAAVLSFSIKNKNYSILFLTAAIMVGYSRIYLAQHFLEDVIAGSVIGLISAIICWLFFDGIFRRWSGLKK